MESMYETHRHVFADHVLIDPRQTHVHIWLVAVLATKLRAKHQMPPHSAAQFASLMWPLATVTTWHRANLHAAALTVQGLAYALA